MRFLFMYCLDLTPRISEKKNCFSRPLLRARTWVYVGGSTHRVGLRSAMTHPPALSLSLSVQRLDGIQHTNTLDWIHHADWASGLKWNAPRWFVLRAAVPLCLLRTPTLRCLYFNPLMASLSVAAEMLKTSQRLIEVHSLSQCIWCNYHVIIFSNQRFWKGLGSPVCATRGWEVTAAWGNVRISQSRQTCCFCSAWGD